MIGYKICQNPVSKEEFYTKGEFYLVELEIPDDAIVIESKYMFLFGDPEGVGAYCLQNLDNKCRCNKAVVTKIHGGVKSVISLFDPSFIYEVGKEVTPYYPFEEGDFACGSGIHFFKTKEQALKYGKNQDIFHNREITIHVDLEYRVEYTPIPLQETGELESSN